MDSSKLGKLGLVSLGLITVGLWGGLACSSSPPDADGSGGATGGLGTGGLGTGGGSGGATGGQSGYPCNENLNGAGGAIYLPNCDEWLGIRAGDEIDFSCGQGGEGGGGGEGGASSDPALQRVCENGSNPDFGRIHPVFHCLNDLTDSVCSSTHTADVTACLTQEAPCEEDLQALGCTAMMNECEALQPGTCYWAMVAARNPDYIEDCFEEPRSDESCVDRFMRCAWGL